MKVSELGEFGVIYRVLEAISRSRDPSRTSWQKLVVENGDDAAAWIVDSALELATTDTMVEGVHFVPGSFRWRELGWKALSINLSDIAAMGGIPTYAFLSLSMPGASEVKDILDLVEGMLDLASREGIAVVGGNMTSAPVLVVTVALMGRAEYGKLLLRSTAKPGDLVAVTGRLGASSAAVEMIKRRLALPSELQKALHVAHFHPEPRVAEGQAIVQCGVRCATDISDGLVGDLTHICQASQVGAFIGASDVPVHPAARDAFGEREALRFALVGGEDYELLFCGDADAIGQAKSRLSTPVTVIGRIVPEHEGRVAVYDDSGQELLLDSTGWNHFRK
ncbi:MAG: thiamine-phosphate kinase [Chloroflexi bacterium]|nr:thiamine-phosphate kinase [Chloroflexota bacterium]